MNRWLGRLTPLLLLVVALAQLGAGPAATLTASIQPGTDAAHALLHVRVAIPAGLHAQSHTPLDDSLIPLVLKTDPAPGVQFGTPVYPLPLVENFAALGQVSIYTGTIDITVPLTFAPGPTAAISGTVHYQACNDTSCFPPRTVHFQASPATATPTTAPATAPAVTSSAAAPPRLVTPVASDASPQLFGRSIDRVGTPFLFAAAFAIGIIFNAVPCVLPVVPLKIVGWYEASGHDRRKSVGLGTAFSLGLIAVFGVLALFIVVFRTLQWGGLFQHTWFTVGIVVVLLAVAASQFGLFEFRLPTAAYGFDPRHDTLSGNFLFGILTALLSTPCTIGAFSAVMAWALKQPAALGVAAVMTVGVGMAFPYFVLSGFPEVARRFPRVGPWPELIKQEMGIVLLAVALFFARPLLPAFVGDKILYWGMFLIVLAAMLFLLTRTFSITPRLQPRLIATAFAMLVIVPSAYAVRLFTADPYHWQPYTDAALAAARATGKPVVVDFTADWCSNCHVDEKLVLNDRRIYRAVQDAHAVMIKADVTHDAAPALPLLGRLDPAGEIPLLAVYLPDRNGPKLLSGLYSVADVQHVLNPGG